MSEKSNLKNVDKSFLETLSKSDLIKLLLKVNAIKPIKIDTSVPKPKRPASTPHKSVKDNTKIPPPKFRDDNKSIPLPKTETSKII